MAVGMNWHIAHGGEWEYIHVTRSSDGTMTEHEAIDHITGCSLDISSLSDLKTSGSISFVRVPDVGNDCLRIYYVASQGAEVERTPLATVLVDTSRYDVSGRSQQGSADVYGLLRIPSVRKTRGTLAIPAGTVAIDHAKALLAGMGLRCIADASTAALTVDAVFDDGTSYLSVLNYLTDFAGFSAAYTDAYGTVRLDRYKKPSLIKPSATFSDSPTYVETVTDMTVGGMTWADLGEVAWNDLGEATWDDYLQRPGKYRQRTTIDPGIPYLAKVSYELDGFDVANVVVCTCSQPGGIGDDETTLMATAINDDPTSPYSTVSRGYEVTRSEHVSDVSSQDALQAHAETLLAEESSLVESIEVTHPWTPEVEPRDVAVVDYSLAGRTWAMAVTAQHIESTPAADTKSSMRRFT